MLYLSIYPAAEVEIFDFCFCGRANIAVPLLSFWRFYRRAFVTFRWRFYRRSFALVGALTAAFSLLFVSAFAAVRLLLLAL